MTLAAQALALAAPAGERLARKHLLEAGLFSVRIPGGGGLAVVGADGLARVLEAAESAADPWTALHARIYQRRGDAGALFTGFPPWSMALARLGAPMPPVFDEQVRHLGPSVLQVEGPEYLDACRNAHFLPDRCLILGTTPDRAVFNAELLEKCAQAYLLASLAQGGSQGRVKRIPLLVRLIAASRLRRDQRLAAAAIAAGGFATTATAY